MVNMTWSLCSWLWMYGKKEDIPLIMLGHTELLTREMYQEYLEWVQTDEGREYLKGGSKYRPMKWEEECAAIGDSNRRASRKWGVQYIAGWLAGSAHARHEAAKELAQYIEVCELLEDDAWLKETECVPRQSHAPATNTGGN